MNVFSFNKLDDLDQLVTLLDKGVFLAYRIKGVYLVKLYQINDFYVETYCHIEHNRVDSMRSFSCTEQLAPYLKNIKLNI